MHNKMTEKDEMLVSSYVKMLDTGIEEFVIEAFDKKPKLALENKKFLLVNALLLAAAQVAVFANMNRQEMVEECKEVYDKSFELLQQKMQNS